MKVAYLLESEHAREILEDMIIPQLEKGVHGVDVVGMMFFFDNAYMLVEGSDIAARLQALSEKTGVLLMACDRCCYQRDIADKLILIRKLIGVDNHRAKTEIDTLINKIIGTEE